MVKINGTDYALKPITRGQVREIEATEDESLSADLLVQFTVGEGLAIDSLPMPDFVDIAEWAVQANKLDRNGIEPAKKN